MSYTQIYYHIIFSTKHRYPALTEDKKKRVYNYLWSILKNKNCHLYRIGGIVDHIHILTELHSTVCLSDLIRDMKSFSSTFIKEKLVPDFPGWQREYAAFSKSHSHHQMVKAYIANQEEHHKTETFLEEYKRLLNEEGIEFEERHLQ